MNEPRLTSKAIKEMDEAFSLRQEAVEILGQVVDEWNSDPMSVQCFDLRTVERANYVLARLKKVSPWG